MPKPRPEISIVIPTLNAAKVLAPCLKSIRSQNYPQDLIEIIIADGGSTDSTLKISQKYSCTVVNNPLKTAEAGKAVGAGESTAEFIALVDSDNILPDSGWLKRMLAPLKSNPKIIGSEPISFTYRPRAGFIERYSALIGANDPYAYISGVYDKQSLLSGNWTGLNLPIIDHPDYLEVKLLPGASLPTIGANGTILRRSFITDTLDSPYLFDIDLISARLNHTQKPLLFAKVKCGIIHTYCESSVSKFFRKQRRRLVDLYTFRSLRHFNWGRANRLGIIKYLLYSLTVFPVLFDILKGFFRRPDPAWFFHPVAVYSSLYFYTTVTVKYWLGLVKPLNRTNWSQ